MLFNFHFTLSPDGIFRYADPRFFCLISSYSQPLLLTADGYAYAYEYSVGWPGNRVDEEETTFLHKIKKIFGKFTKVKNISQRRNF